MEPCRKAVAAKLAEGAKAEEDRRFCERVRARQEEEAKQEKKERKQKKKEAAAAQAAAEAARASSKDNGALGGGGSLPPRETLTVSGPTEGNHTDKYHARLLYYTKHFIQFNREPLEKQFSPLEFIVLRTRKSEESL